MAVEFLDEFTGVDDTDLETHNSDYNVWAGSFFLQNNNCWSGSAGSYAAYTNFNSTDYDVSADIKAGSTGGYGRVMGRCGSSLNRNDIYDLYHAYSGTIYLLKRVSNSQTILDSTSLAAPTSTPENIRLSMVGTTIKGYVDDVEYFSVTDSSHSSGIAQFGFYDPSTNYIDNFLIETPGGGTVIKDLIGGTGIIPFPR